MAPTIGIMGPYKRTDPLAPGQSTWVDFHPPSPGFANCALAVSASPQGPEEGALKVENVGIATGPMGVSAGCNVTNNGTTTVTNWSVLVGVIVPTPPDDPMTPSV